VTRSRQILIQILPEASNETPMIEELARSLVAEIAEQDVESFDMVKADQVPSDAKGIGLIVGWIAVHVSLRNLEHLAQAIADWAARNGRDVEIRYGQDVIKVARVTSLQQEKLINEWLNRHSRA